MCDCGWNHSPVGSAGTVTLFDHNQKKVVACETLTKTNGNNVGNYSGNSNNMETNGLQRIFDKIGDNLQNKGLTLGHDHDNRLPNLLKEYNHLGIKESLDLGHAAQELKRKANTFFENCARSIKDKSKPQRKTLITKLIVWFKLIIMRVSNKDTKEKLWKNTPQHLIGNYKECKHPNDISDYKGPGRPRKKFAGKENYWIWTEGKNDKKLTQKLDEFLNSTVNLVRETSTTRTQHNESINANIRIHAPKNKMFASSNEARVQMAIEK